MSTVCSIFNPLTALFRRGGRYETLCEQKPPPNDRVRSDPIIRLGAERRLMRNWLRRIDFEPLEGHKEC